MGNSGTITSFSIQELRDAENRPDQAGSTGTGALSPDHPVCGSGLPTRRHSQIVFYEAWRGDQSISPWKQAYDGMTNIYLLGDGVA
jgi:hypothetical protein